MKAISWSAALGILVFTVSFAILKFKGNVGSIRIGNYGPFETISFWVNLVVALVSLLSLYIALATYLDAQESGKEQILVLEATRKALEVSVSIAQSQQQILDENLKISAEHFKVVKEQWDLEKERLSRKPKIKIGLGDFEPERLSKGEPIRIRANDSGHTPFDFIVTNIGNAPIIKPTIVISTSDSRIQIDKRDFHLDRRNRHRLQYSSNELNNFLPETESGGGHTIQIDLKIPVDSKAFNLSFSIFGENLPKIILEIKIELVNH